MPQTTSAKRALRVSRRRETINKKIKDVYKRIVSELRTGNKSDITKMYSGLDRAAKKGVIHKRKAARLKSRLARLIKKTAAPQSPQKTARKVAKH